MSGREFPDRPGGNAGFNPQRGGHRNNNRGNHAGFDENNHNNTGYVPRGGPVYRGGGRRGHGRGGHADRFAPYLRHSQTERLRYEQDRDLEVVRLAEVRAAERFLEAGRNDPVLAPVFEQHTAIFERLLGYVNPGDREQCNKISQRVEEAEANLQETLDQIARLEAEKAEHEERLARLQERIEDLEADLELLAHYKVFQGY